MAVRWVESTGWRGALRRGQVGEDEFEDEVLKRTTLCITTPYDRDLVACVDARRAVLACYQAFESRHGAVLVPPE